MLQVFQTRPDKSPQISLANHADNESELILLLFHSSSTKKTMSTHISKLPREIFKKIFLSFSALFFKYHNKKKGKHKFFFNIELNYIRTGSTASRKERQRKKRERKKRKKKKRRGRACNSKARLRLTEERAEVSKRLLCAAAPGVLHSAGAGLACCARNRNSVYKYYMRCCCLML